ncbi:MAG: hypothetical protein LAO30_21440, partial [Acidobacteriia bacterium]|nr:hypothetical protein [Terriglobia bacterium]
DATREFVDFRILPSVEGVVIRPNADDLEVKTDPDTVYITRARGLVLSDDRDRVLGRAVANRHRLFDFKAWSGPANQSFTERRSALERVIASSAPGARTRPRLDLARFYFANKFGAETLSVLAQIARPASCSTRLSAATTILFLEAPKTTMVPDFVTTVVFSAKLPTVINSNGNNGTMAGCI